MGLHGIHKDKRMICTACNKYAYRSLCQECQWDKELIEAIITSYTRDDIAGATILADYFCTEYSAYNRNQDLTRKTESRAKKLDESFDGYYDSRTDGHPEQSVLPAPSGAPVFRDRSQGC